MDRVYLLVLDGDSSSIFNLPRDGRVTIGRAPEVALHIGDRAASRRHAEVVIAGGEAEIVDLGSHNGTLLNDERISGPRALASGDVITIGEVSLVFHSARAANRPLDLRALRQRLDDEIGRAAHFGRPLAVVAFDFRGRPADPAALPLRAVDFVAQSGGSKLIAVFPELAVESVPQIADTDVTVATYPDDGIDPESLLAATGKSAPPTELVLGDRKIRLADPAMLRLFELVKRLAKSELPILITGETGSGKESAAWAVHHGSKRAKERFVPINCAALPENLVESELFGYEKGAFSGANLSKPGLLELSAGGTVFFDEIGELPLPAQAKLLRALEEKKVMRLGGTKEIEVDLRIVAATNRDLESEVLAGRFRQDLFFRLSGATVVLPPLRDRPRELSMLMRAFLAEACERLERKVPALSRAALATLAGYSWPGNVRELKNTMEFIAAAAEDVVDAHHLPGRLARVEAPPPEPPKVEATAPDGPQFRVLADEIEDLERTRLKQALEAAGGVKAQAARLIGMPLRTFVAKLKQYGIG
jgi:DNA-binding NtrC family response regulator/pSer/pThr/pTyr-binding forkhead associated (FHA) protein